MERLSYKIRAANIADIRSVVKLERESFPNYPYPSEAFHYYYRKCQDLFLVAESEGMILGYVLGCSEDEVGHVVSIAVAQKFRGMGIGRKLMIELERRMMGKGVRRIRLEVSVSNDIARRLYLGLGYKELARIRGYYPDGSDALVMEKLI